MLKQSLRYIKFQTFLTAQILIIISFQEEKSESQISAMENQLHRAEKIMKSKDQQPMKRTWFQTHQERLDEKERFKLVQGDSKKSYKGKKDEHVQRKQPAKGEKPKTKKKSGKKSDGSSDRANQELTKVMLMQARLAKKKSKPKTMRLSNDAEELPRSRLPSKNVKKSGSAFADDLTDVRRTSVKGFRNQGKTNSKYSGKRK